jgi:hypothetical protein
MVLGGVEISYERSTPVSNTNGTSLYMRYSSVSWARPAELGSWGGEQGGWWYRGTSLTRNCLSPLGPP